MTLPGKIRMSLTYGRAVYLISLTVTLAAAASVLVSPFLVPACLILKLLSIPVILYLLVSFQGNGPLYFWLNMGISRTEYYAVPVIVEFLVFLLLLSICGVLGHVIG